jgi:hypothetical protein
MISLFAVPMIVSACSVPLILSDHTVFIILCFPYSVSIPINITKKQAKIQNRDRCDIKSFENVRFLLGNKNIL